MISVVDLQLRKTLANILVAGKLGFAQDDGGGHVFIAVQDRNEIALFDTQLVSSMLQTMRGQSTSPNSSGPDSPLPLDWSASIHPSTEGRLRFFRLGQQCPAPTALAADSRHLRLFVACGNFTLAVLNAETGALVTSLPTGPGADALGYDAARGLIFVPNGGGWGTLTIIRQDVTDTYAVVQNLPTRERAGTLALDPDTGLVYLVTIQYGVKLGAPPFNGIGTLALKPVDSSFQVLVVGN